MLNKMSIEHLLSFGATVISIALLGSSANLWASDGDESLTAKVQNARNTYQSRKLSSSISQNIDFEFEGKYAIGGKTCTVTPIKMAYKVKCPQHRSPIYFVFEQMRSSGKLVYTSESQIGGNVIIVFDDETFSKGTYDTGKRPTVAIEKIR